MRNRSQILIATIILALALVVAVFAWVKSEYGPDEHAQPGFMTTCICANPSCRATITVTPQEEKDMGLDPWDGPGVCPTCGQKTLRRAERCVNCGKLIPSPDPDKLLDATCPYCGSRIFGSLGGKWPAEPHRPQHTDKE